MGRKNRDREEKYVRTDRRTDERTQRGVAESASQILSGQTDGWTDEWTNTRTDERTDTERPRRIGLADYQCRMSCQKDARTDLVNLYIRCVQNRKKLTAKPLQIFFSQCLQQ
jgi:hypothetical protein